MHAAEHATTSRALARYQAISGLVFFVFAALHLLNTMFAMAGPDAYNRFQRAVRPFYQYPLVELVVIFGALFVHLYAAVRRMRLRRGSTQAVQLRSRLHRYSAWFLMAVIFGHISATRIPPAVWGVYLEFGGVSWTLAYARWLFLPYYTLLTLTGTYHSLNGLVLALGMLGVRVPRVIQRGPAFWAPIALVSVLALLGLASMAGYLMPIPDPFQTPGGKFAMGLLSKLMS
jgi:succinate dehydrogenase/fumarate reductase cytochrome b subunit